MTGCASPSTSLRYPSNRSQVPTREKLTRCSRNNATAPLAPVPPLGEHKARPTPRVRDHRRAGHGRGPDTGRIAKRRRPHLPWRAVRALFQQQNAGLPSCAVRPALTPPTVVPSRSSRGAIGQLITRISLRQRSKTPSNEHTYSWRRGWHSAAPCRETTPAARRQTLRQASNGRAQRSPNGWHIR
jgi:hypothetical protein